MADNNWIAPTILAGAAAFGSALGAIRTWMNGRKQDAAAEKLVKIGQATDGNLSALTTDNKLLAQKVDSLEKLLLQQTKSADAAATVASVAAAAGAPHPPEAEIKG